MIFQSLRSAVDFATHIPRYREILGVLMKYGFANELRLAALEHLLKIEPHPGPAEPGEMVARPFPERVRLALEELGPTFIKFGQILSSRRDLIADELYEELVKLQDRVPPFGTDVALKIVEEELGAPAGELFAEFEEEPIGGASIAQVHRARLPDGRLVAVKIQRPDIQRRIEIDLAIARDIAAFLAKHVPEISGVNPVGIVEEFAANLTKELDFTNDARNALRFGAQFAGNEKIRVPFIYEPLCTKKVLTMEYMKGLPVDAPELLREHGIDPVKLSQDISVLIYQQIFEFGFFHGDPHPGNITILPGGVVGLYDYGMMGVFSPEFRLSVARMIYGLAEKNHRAVMRAILEMSEEGYARDPHRMLHDVEAFAEENLNRPLREINLGQVLNRLLELLRNNQLRMKGSFYLGIKALSQVEAIGRMLNPALEFVTLGGPYALRTLSTKYRPRRLARLMQRLLADTVDFLEEFPHDFRALYLRLKRGDFNIPLEHKIDPQGFEPLRRTLDSIANRLTEGILAASLLICSSILILANVPPHVFGYPALGLVGLVAGVLMLLRLVFSIGRHGGL